MDIPTYTALTRQQGLLREMTVLANNVANLSTTGFRREGVIFSEFVRDLGDDAPSVSMASAQARQTYLTQGGLTQTGGSFDIAIEGAGFFVLATPDGERLTRAGHFTPNAEGELVTPDGHRLLDTGGSPIFVPADAGPVAIAADGTVSADGQPLAQIAVMQPEDPALITVQGGVMLGFDGALQPAEMAVLHQGFLEESNVDPIAEMARLITVQRAYEATQKLLDREDERIRSVVQTLGR